MVLNIGFVWFLCPKKSICHNLASFGVFKLLLGVKSALMMRSKFFNTSFRWIVLIMFADIRKTTSNLVVKALLFLLIISFAAWGVGDMLQPAATGSSVATVGDKEIAVQEVYNDFQREMARFRQLSGNQEIDEQMSLAIGGSVVDRAINRALLAVGADKMDVAISDDLVRQSIHQDDTFKEDGKFSRPRFEQIMFSNGLDEDQFIELVRSDLAREQVISVLVSGSTLPESVAKDLYKHRQEKRSADVVVIDKNNVGDVAAPSNDEIKKYYDDNIANFMAPEYRKLTLLHIKPADIAKNIDVPLEDMQEAFEQRKAEFTKEEVRTVEQMVFTTEDEAKAAINLLAEGKSFEEIAKEKLGLDKESLLLGDVKRDELPEELRDTVFNLVMRGVDGPVQSALGWHVVNVTNIDKGVDPEFDTVKDKLKEDLALEMAGEELFGISNDIEDALGGGATIDEAAKTAGFDLVMVDSTDKTGISKDGKSVLALAAFPVVLEEAFKIDMQADPAMKDDGQGGYFMVRLDGVTESTARPFDTVKEAVVAFVQDIKRFDAAKKQADMLLEKIKGGAKLMDAATEAKLTLTSEKNFTRSNSTLPADVTKALFDAKVGEAASGITQTGHLVAVLSEVKSIDGSADQAAVNALRRDMANGVSNDLQGQFVNALRGQLGVKIDRAMVNRMFTPEAPYGSGQ